MAVIGREIANHCERVAYASLGKLPAAGAQSYPDRLTRVLPVECAWWPELISRLIRRNRTAASQFLSSDRLILWHPRCFSIKVLEAHDMDAIQVMTRMTPCGSQLPELEVPMINAMVACLGSEHQKLNEQILQMAFAATRLASDPHALAAKQQAIEVWEEIRFDLWSHLQIEDELVFAWGEAHHAISTTMLNTLGAERQELRNLIAALPALSSDVDSQPQAASDHTIFAPTLLALAQTLDSHVERYDGEVLPSILRALFQR
jgi:iron-sulfur cluster repair protein YtfE (RIC family)